MNIDEARSYKSEAMLDAVIKRNFPEGTRYLTVCNRSGRFTAVFGFGQNPELPPMTIATFGFVVLN